MSEYDAALGAFQALESDPSAQEGNQPDAPVGAPGAAPVESPSPSASEPTSKSIDISGLPEEAQIFLRAREREMQADYTQKTQAAAAQRAEAEQAMQFIQALNSDPQFALQAYQTLEAQLAQQGYLQAQEAEQYDEFGQEIGPDPYEEKIADLEQWRNQMEDEWQTASLSAHLDRQISVIQSQHPEWTEQDMQSVIDLGFATNGDLMAASSQYQAVQDQVLSRYLSSKSSVNTPAALPSGGATQVPLAPKTEEQTRAAAMEIIRAQLG